jgi:hypothetical protein
MEGRQKIIILQQKVQMAQMWAICKGSHIMFEPYG